MDLPTSVRCPVCGDTVDLTDVPAATAHMSKDEKHRQDLARIKAGIILDELASVASPIFRRVGG